jgi:hypothetical protein
MKKTAVQIITTIVPIALSITAKNALKNILKRA